MPYEDFKDFPRKTVADKVLRDKAINNAKNPRYNGYQWRIDSMVYKLFQ